MRVLLRITLAVALLLPIVPSLHAQVAPPTVDVTGTWNVQAQAFFAQVLGESAVTAGSPQGLLPTPDCIFSGTATIVQDGSTLSGDASMTLTSGGDGCPPEMMAMVTGTVSGSQVTMGLLTGAQGLNLGEAIFSGGVLLNGAALKTQAAAAAPPMGGTFAATTPPFEGTSGTWSAVQRAVSVLAIPTLGAAGLTLLVLLILAAGFIFLRRTASEAAP